MKSLLVIALLSTPLFASEKSICGDRDDRVLSNDKRIARASKVNEFAGCTMTMIGRSCAISAGHCVDVLEKATFNIPHNDNTSIKPEDIYLRTKDYLRYKNDGRGKDWAIVKLLPNKITGKYPGDVQGFYSVNLTSTPLKGDRVRITGYGVDSDDSEKSFLQQTNTGLVKRPGRWLRPTTLEHLVDTMGGNSGSSIILENTDEIVGIHTHGGCNSSGANFGTLIAKNNILKDVIVKCLEWEKGLAD